ncbi:hypothetical protein F2P45_14735 [Massilia sp. CCM 8733]|uniref:DUF2946 domain-containing protein n=1 Tax=Massilia mucilaginosa TaxID=2609282 RepID=A0ABX0NTU6_9BURK|nr:hypothetical protein [Massilia mucilaginosa]NHZ90262.1 hypothetical protein [Massilia mucilaginosa]
MKCFRTLLMWLMLLAIPLQGFAAASSALCEAATAPLASHAAAASMDEGHCDEPGSATPDSAAKCSNCAFCCVGMAIAPACPAPGTAPPLASELIAYAPMHVTAHIPGGLERPPHSPIA